MKRDVTYCRTFLETMKREGFWIKRIKSEVYKKKHMCLLCLFLVFVQIKNQPVFSAARSEAAQNDGDAHQQLI